MAFGLFRRSKEGSTLDSRTCGGTARDNERLRHRILEAIRSGKLADCVPERVWAGPGRGTPCFICGERIEAGEVEFELEFPSRDQACPSEDRHAHHSCF